MPRGGKRTGRQGEAYANRTDLNPTATAGALVQNIRPHGNRPTQGEMAQGVPSAPRDVGGAAPGPPPGPLPGSLTGLTAPTERPLEPITSGLQDPQQGVLPADPHWQIRRLYFRYPSEELRRLVERL